MIVKMFTHGTGGSSGVFNYLLKDAKQLDGNRLDAELLRGDIETQKLLIDGLPFKQKYTSGCLSFEEAPDQVTTEQKNALMDGFEKVITAGLDDRVSFSWIEHRDKGRLELNFVIANVDLKYGRLFQSYIHSQDLERVNAWKDIQNIEQQFTDPNDPAKTRNLRHTDNLPRDVKSLRIRITDTLENLVENGLITNRQDVIESLEDGGYEVLRQTARSISIKNPLPKAKKNIRLTGPIYERDYRFKPKISKESGESDSLDRQSDRDRIIKAKRVYDKQFKRKQDYHTERHGKPKRSDANNPAIRDRSESEDNRMLIERQESLGDGIRQPRFSDHKNDERSFDEYEADRERQRDEVLRLDDHKIMGSRLIRSNFNGLRFLHRDNLEIENHAKAVNRSDSASITSKRRYDQVAAENNRLKRRGYSQAQSTINIIIGDESGSAREFAQQIFRANNDAQEQHRRIQRSGAEVGRGDEVGGQNDGYRSDSAGYNEALEGIGAAITRFGSIEDSRQQAHQLRIAKAAEILKAVVTDKYRNMPRAWQKVSEDDEEPSLIFNETKAMFDKRQLEILDGLGVHEYSNDKLVYKELAKPESKEIIELLLDPQVERARHDTSQVESLTPTTPTAEPKPTASTEKTEPPTLTPYQSPRP